MGIGRQDAPEPGEPQQPSIKARNWHTYRIGPIKWGEKHPVGQVKLVLLQVSLPPIGHELVPCYTYGNHLQTSNQSLPDLHSYQG